MNPTNPLLIEIPKRLETPRLVLRAPQEGDGPVMNEAVTESLAELRPWMPWAKVAPTVEDSEIFTRRACIAWIERKEFQYRGFYKDKLVLIAGLVRMDWDVPRFEIGYWTRTSATGQGFMTEAVVALTEMTFETLNAKRVEIRCEATNKGSRRVAERAGFALEAILKNNARGTNGVLSDTCIFALTREEPS